MAQWIKTTGETIEVEPATTKHGKKKFTLEELQLFVGGYIERVRITGKIDMLCNEEGRIKGLPPNAKASEIANQAIVGDVLVVPRGEW